MSYTPHIWTTGETITAEKMNNLEDGIQDAGPWDAVIRLTHSNDSGEDTPANLVLSIVSGTFAEIYSKLQNGGCPCILVEYYHPWGIRFSAPMAYVVYVGDGAFTIVIAGVSGMSNLYLVYGSARWTSAGLSWV